MKFSINPIKKNIRKTSKKTLVFSLVLVMFFSLLLMPLKTVQAQLVVAEPVVEAQTGIKIAMDKAESAYNKAKATLSKLLLKAGATSFQQVVRAALNKIAYDTATYLGSGDRGQKPLFITEDLGSYLANVGDAAAGQFIESFVTRLSVGISAECQKTYQACEENCQNYYEIGSNEGITCIKECREKAYLCGRGEVGVGTSSKSGLSGAGAASATHLGALNICQPSSLEAKVKIGLGLVEYQSPMMNANCTASKMISNWDDAATKMADWKDPNFLDNIKGIFNPTSHDLGIYMTARSDLASAKAGASTLSLNDFLVNKGWLSKRNAAGEMVGTPGDAERKAQTTEAAAKESLLRTTGDIVVDAANVFVNQLAITKFNDLMSNLGKKVTDDSSGSSRRLSGDLTNPESDSTTSYSATGLKESLYSIIEPDFGVKADYDILASLTVCFDKKNPGPTECVIDSKFSQAISENKTVIEAVREGYINSDWQLTEKTIEGAYSLRNVSILRKYRILPIGWEEAIKRAYADSAKVKRITVMDMISCFDESDEYQKFSSNFNVADQEWCRGLVDPNWVLKAPLNYCSKQGSGAHIISKIVSPSYGVKGAADYVASVFSVSRDEEYCADEKTCIKEKADGSCEAYGYCNEEKRTWNFSADSCDPIYNTCQNFTNAATGQNVSYLKNTLDYANCDTNSVGCRQYSLSGSYDVATGVVSWGKNKTIYFNNNLEICDKNSEGCTELIRVKPTWGVNLIMNSNFKDDTINRPPKNWYFDFNSSLNTFQVVNLAEEPIGGVGRALKISGERKGSSPEHISVKVVSNAQKSLLPDNFQLIPNQAYTLSVDVYIPEGTAGTARIYLGELSDGFVASTSKTGAWQHLSVTRTAAANYTEPVFYIENQNFGTKNVMYLRNPKFEVSNYETNFNAYGSAYKVYEKLIPPYLESVCYNNISSATKDYTLKTNAPAVCYDFARRCNRDEVGCEKFVGVKNGITVSAQVTASDYCWGDCLDYDVYVSKGSYFNSPEAENIIPTKATACRAEVVGCNEFTNLDALNVGGENKEYYSAMKRCVKPSQGTCGTFYSWEGTKNGYQLRSYVLEREINKNQPKLTFGEVNDSATCDQNIYHKKVGEVGYNPDCLEFINSAGDVFYALLSATITCSEDCHTYRMTEKNIDRSITSRDACVESGENGSTYWDAVAGACYSCLNGGQWDNATKSCLYQAIPGEGKICTAAESGCREYNGNSGNNVKLLTSFDFENGSQGWLSANGTLNTVAVANEKDGHSIYYENSKNYFVRTKVSQLVKEGKSYAIRFIAKADETTNLNIFFTDNADNNPQRASFSAGKITLKGGGEWHIYQANLANLDHAISENETLTIMADNNFYFDDFALTEITNRHYLVKNSSVVPDICFYDINSVYRGAEYNLGCTQYKDRDNLTHNLRKFSKLCSSSAVGCEQMIATQNYSSYASGIWGDTNNNGVCDVNEKDCVQVGGDEIIYTIFDSSKQCNSADLGCSRLGQGIAAGSDWSDVFRKNNPNLYASALCGPAQVGCEKWIATDGSESYFKNPGNEVCQYRSSHDLNNPVKAWYKIPVKRCDSNGNGVIDTETEKAGAVCSTDSMCSAGSCIIDNNDYPCDYSYFKTFGIGGAGNQVPVPSKQVALCQATASGCTEYIDPVSSFSPELLDNPNDNIQQVALSPNKLYILSVDKGDKDNQSDTILKFEAIIKPLLADNNLGISTTTITIDKNTSDRIMFASLANSSVTISGGEVGKKIELKEAIINYQLKNSIDVTSCNGVVNPGVGCILFNERTVAGATGLAANKFDAVNSVSGQAPQLCDSDSDNCTANQLVKVKLDRVCSKWLDCVAYFNDPNTNERVCLALGQCTRLDDKNECANFEDVPSGNTSFASARNKDKTGYYLLNNYHLSEMKEVGLKVPGANYDFENGVAPLCSQTTGEACSLETLNSLIISEPEKAPTDYPAQGTGYLRVPPSTIISLGGEKSLTVQGGQTYFLNFLLNTRGSIGAQVEITSDNKKVNVKKDFVSNNGWTRQIMPFNVPGEATKIKIDLQVKNISGAEASRSTAVYFDDINIEPVLEVGSKDGYKQYVARECRLYPNNESLTCVNKNENVLSDGWEGYCLEHDPDNPSVCLLWYPVDKINAAELSKNNSGYQGTFPLNYCTEVNGNFELVKYLKAAQVSFTSGTASGYASNIKGGDHFCTTDNDGCNGDGDPNYKTIIAYGRYSNDHSYVKKLCVPKEEKLILKTNSAVVSDLGKCTEDGVLYYEGWAMIGDGLKTKGYEFGDGENLCQASGNHYKHYKNWCENRENLGLDETKNDSFPVRVYDYDNPPATANGLKFISSAGTDGDDSKIYRLTCNNFVQVVNDSGENMAWVGRISAQTTEANSTPPFFVEGDKNLFYNSVSSEGAHGLQTYYRNLSKTPYGAASWPDSFSIANSNGAIPLKNQYSDRNNENRLAGLPYGCSNYKESEVGNGCNYIGYCSNNPDVYCLTDANLASGARYVAKNTCGDYGVCEPLWKNYLGSGSSVDFSSILSKLFLKSYNSYSLIGSSYKTGNIRWDYSGLGQCKNNERPAANYSSLDDSRASFCYVEPSIDNIAVNHDDSGVYELRFITKIDLEQQPLKEIYIDWGDGFVQTITGQDSRPDKNNPHIFYHYYRQVPTGKIEIKIKDNWGKTRERSWTFKEN